MNNLLFLSFLPLTLCGFVHGVMVSQPRSTVKIQPGFSTTFQCHVQAEGHYSFFWIKVPLDGASVYIANSNSLRGDLETFGQFKNNPRIKVVLNETSFSLSFLSTEAADIATYICGAHGYEQIEFGNGSRLMFEDTAAINGTMLTESHMDRKIKPSVFVPVLSATNVVSVFIIIVLIYHILQKNKSGVSRPDRCPGERNTDDVSYAALTFSRKQKKNTKRRPSLDTSVIYSGVVQHQEGVSAC